MCIIGVILYLSDGSISPFSPEEYQSLTGCYDRSDISDMDDVAFLGSGCLQNVYKVRFGGSSFALKKPKYAYLFDKCVYSLISANEICPDLTPQFNSFVSDNDNIIGYIVEYVDLSVCKPLLNLSKPDNEFINLDFINKLKYWMFKFNNCGLILDFKQGNIFIDSAGDPLFLDPYVADDIYSITADWNGFNELISKYDLESLKIYSGAKDCGSNKDSSVNRILRDLGLGRMYEI